MNLADIALLVVMTALLVAGAAWLLHSRARRQLERRMEARRQQMSQLIEHAQCVLWEAEVVLETGDWEWHMKLHPSAFCRQLFRGRLPEPRGDLWGEFRVENRKGMDQRARAAIEGGRPGYEQEFKAEREGRAYWLHENVSITRLSGDRYWLVGLVTDITAQREAEEARRQSELTVERILAHADCLLWRATVVRGPEGGLNWIHFDIPRSQFSELLFGDRIYQRERGFWATIEIPEQADMDRRSTTAILGGAPGYTQQFRAITKAGRLFWLHERVSITRLEEGRWSLVGVITDISAQHEAEAALQQSETRLAHLLERADSTIWQARVKRDAGGVPRWDMFIPRSQLYRRIFGMDPNQPVGFEWKERGVPEADEMEQRAHDAINRGVSGYDQVFHTRGPEGDIWLSESVSIVATGPDSWDLVGVITDITARQQAEAALQTSQTRLAKLLELADCLVWEATVTLQPDDTLHWNLYTQRSVLYRRIFGNREETALNWHTLEVPEFEEMRQRALHAVKHGAEGYTQEFHVVQPGGPLWLREVVTMRRLADGAFQMVGVITDITAQRRAEEAQRQSEARLATLLDRADCMIWQGEVRRRGADTYDWELFTPRSQLYRRIFGGDPDGECHFDWSSGRVPEFSEMRARSRRALAENLPGYEQVFHYQHAEFGDIWLNEKVTIKLVGPDRWELVGIITDISAQRQLEAARLASDKRLHELLGRADCLLWESTVVVQPVGWDWQHHIQPSLLYRRLTGASLPAPGVSMWPEERVPERQEMDRRCREALLGGRPGYEQIFHFVKPDGEAVWISENVTIQRLDENRYWLVGVAVDITAKQLSEAARQASEQRLLEILSRAECLLWEATAEVAADGWRWDFNIQPSGLAQKIFGAPLPPAATGLWDSVPIPEKAAMDERSRVAMLSGRSGYEQVFHVERPSGGVIWISESVTIRPLGGSRFSLVGVAVDISAQLRAEEALAAEKERLAVTLRAMHESVITTDTAGNIQFMNPAAAELTGWGVAESAGRTVAEVLRLESNRTNQPVPVPYAKVARGGVVADLPGQTSLVTRGGKRRQVEGCCAPIHATDSRVTGMVLVLRDVTEQERLEQELVRATRLESVGVLAGGIAHDFNNILTAVMGNLALAQLDLTPDSPAAGSVRSAEKAALRARDLTQQLLTFAKGGEPVRAAVQLEAVVREMAAFGLHGSQVKAHYDMAPDLWPADADKGQIGRVVQNLVINAVQAMPRGGSLRIVARNHSVDGLSQPGLAPGNYLQIAITDTGEGIKPENLGRIFDPYFTTKQTGTGLGLAAVYSIVKKHHGHIEVESQVGQGTTFRLWLPALHEQVAAHETRTPWADNRAMKGRVLFMDDEEIIRDMAVALLQRFGLEVDCAVDGAEAVEKYRAALAGGRRYALVLMDLTVPGGMGGLAALGKLKELDPAVTAVVSSGYSSDPVLANYREHGFAAVVAKPYEVGEIARVLRELLPDG